MKSLKIGATAIGLVLLVAPVQSASAFGSKTYYPVAPCGFDAQVTSSSSVAFTHYEYGCNTRVSWRVPGSSTPYFYGTSDATTSGPLPSGRVGGTHGVKTGTSSWHSALT